MGIDTSSFSFRKIRFTGPFTFDLLDVNYCVNLSLSNGLYCTFTLDILLGLRSSIIGCVHIFGDCTD